MAVVSDSGTWSDHPPPSSFTEAPEWVYPVPSMAERAIEATILTIICVVALVGNISLWYIVCSNRSLRTNSNALVLGLSAADILVSAINMPVTIANLIKGDWVLSKDACVVFGFITMVTFIASVMSLGSISINRYYMICHPHKFYRIYTKGKTGLFIAGVWVLAVALAAPPLLGWSEYAYLPNQSFCFCNWRTSISYTFFMVGTCFGGPCSVMTFCYVKIVREIRASRKRIVAAQKQGYKIHKESGGESPRESNKANIKPRALNPIRGTKVGASQIHPDDREGKGENNCALTAVQPFVKEEDVGQITGNDEPGVDKETVTETVKPRVSDVKGHNNTGGDVMSPRSKKAEKRREEHIRLAISFAVVIIVFIISWLPFCITMFLNVFSPNPIPRIPDMITLLLGCANSLCNPIIYGVMNTRFRIGYKRLFTAPCRKLGIAFTKTGQCQAGTLMMNETLSSRSK